MAAADTLSSDHGVPAARNSAISDEEVAALLEKEPKTAGGVRAYDFAAQRINRTQLPMLEVVNKALAARAGHALAALIGRDASIGFESMETIKCGDLQASLPVPGTLAIVRLKPLLGFAYVSVEPQMLLTLLDGFFGGSGRANSDTAAAAAPAAQRFLALMLRTFVPDVAAAWQPVAPIELELVKQETNPRLVQFGSAADSVVACKFVIEFAAKSGPMYWYLPESMLAPLRDALSGETNAAPERKQEPWAPALISGLADAQIDTRAVLAEASMSLRELVTMVPGDIIPIEPPQDVTLYSGDVPLYVGRFGVSQGRNALKITAGASK